VAWGALGLLLLVGCAGADEPSEERGQAPAGELEPLPNGSTNPASEEFLRSHAGYPLFEALERARREFSGNHGEPLGQFAAKCDLATGVHVRDFNCSEGTEVPTTNVNGALCDRPNRLNRECDPGSRFQVLASNTDAVAVAHCRKTGLPGNQYSDIAVIQYNKRNGATCFYQALGVMDGNFKAPFRGTSDASESDTPNPSASPWLSNASTHAIDCRRCHDNGAIIRSPYLAQLTSGPNALPGAGDIGYNKTSPVSYVGKDYQDWTLFSVTVSGNICNGCHRMAYSNTPSSNAGTALDFGLRATATSEVAKNPHSVASPIWMVPRQILYDAGTEASAIEIRNCAAAAKAGTALPAGCSTRQFSSTYRGRLEPAHLDVVL
jgi:hypothetical protein